MGKVEACHEKNTEPVRRWSSDFRNEKSNSYHAGYPWDVQSNGYHRMVALEAFEADDEGGDSEEEAADDRNHYSEDRKSENDCIVLPSASNHCCHSWVVGLVLQGVDSVLVVEDDRS